MVCPVRPVGHAIAWTGHVIHRVHAWRPHGLPWPPGKARTCDSRSEGVRGASGLVRFYREQARAQAYRFSLADPLNPEAMTGPWHHHPLRWQPWPAEPPYINEVRLHWPGDDPPSPHPTVVIEDRIADHPPPVLLYPTTGLIDTWA